MIPRKFSYFCTYTVLLLLILCPVVGANTYQNIKHGDTITLDDPIVTDVVDIFTVSIDDLYAGRSNPYDINTTGLLAWYRMDSTSGTTATDSSGNGYTGTVMNTTFTGTTGKYNSGIALDGVNDYILCPPINPKHNIALENAAYNLSIPTYDGSGEAIHPSVEYFQDGWNGYKYWMAMTPYPQKNDDYENPCIVASNDGINWEVPDGVTNPLYDMPIAGHNADADLAFNPVTNTMHLYFIDTRTAANCAGFENEWWYNHQFLMEMNSTDGTTWSTPQIVIDYNVTTSDVLYVSPSIDIVDGTYYCYMVDSISRRIDRITSDNGINWNSPSQAFDTKIAWHLDMKYIPEHGEWWGLYNTYGAGADLFFISSKDGINFISYPTYALVGNDTVGAWDTSLYRTTFIYDNVDNKIKIWYSAYDSANHAHIGYLIDNATNFLYNVKNERGTGLTISHWVYLNSYPSTGFVRTVNKYATVADYSISVNDGRKMYFEVSTIDDVKSVTNTPANFPIGSWHMATCTDDGETSRIYIDGELVASNTHNILPLRQSTQTVSIGRQDGMGGRNYWNGVIDDVLIYDRALSAEEIKKLYYISANGATIKSNVTNPTVTYSGTPVTVPHNAGELISHLFFGNTVIQDDIRITDPINSNFDVTTTTLYDFHSTTTSGFPPLTTKFSPNVFAGVEGYYWDFENDGVIDSTDQNPVHTYGQTGTYSVNLTVHTSEGNVSIVKPDYITVENPAFAEDPIAWFNWVFSYLFGGF